MRKVRRSTPAAPLARSARAYPPMIARVEAKAVAHSRSFRGPWVIGAGGMFSGVSQAGGSCWAVRAAGGCAGARTSPVCDEQGLPAGQQAPGAMGELGRSGAASMPAGRRASSHHLRIGVNTVRWVLRARFRRILTARSLGPAQWHRREHSASRPIASASVKPADRAGWRRDKQPVVGAGCAQCTPPAQYAPCQWAPM